MMKHDLKPTPMMEVEKALKQYKGDPKGFYEHIDTMLGVYKAREQQMVTDTYIEVDQNGSRERAVEYFNGKYKVNYF